jgi:hypothetical protein
MFGVIPSCKKLFIATNAADILRWAVTLTLKYHWVSNSVAFDDAFKFYFMSPVIPKIIGIIKVTVTEWYYEGA